MAERDKNGGASSYEGADPAFGFRTLTGDTLEARLIRVRLTGDAKGSECSLLFGMEWDAYRQLASGEWMGLLGFARGGESEKGFEEGKLVELRAILKPAVMAAALGSDPDAEQMIAMLLGEGEASTMLRQSESWLVTEVKQQVDLPEELAGGSLKRGYRTTRAAQRSVQTASASSRASLEEIVRQALAGRGLTYERLTDELIRLSYAGENGAWIVLIRTDEEQGLCMIYSVFPEKIPEEMRPEAAVYLMEENYDLAVGGFELDGSDGEVRYRTSLAVSSEGMSAALFMRQFDMNVAAMDRYYPALEDGFENGFAE